jgi:hypothetical protein
MSELWVEPERGDAGPSGRRLRVGLAMPGGFEFGGIGRIMLYTVRAWQASGTGPDWLLVDARGPGSLLLAPLHLLRALRRVARERRKGRLDLLHLNVAGRGSTVRKVILGLWAELLGCRRSSISTISTIRPTSPAGRPGSSGSCAGSFAAPGCASCSASAIGGS